MGKIKMMRGLPGSGKSTVAKALVKSDGNGGRVNRDDLRAMLFESVWTGKREGVVVDCEKAIAAVLLKHGMVPVIDDTNLSAKHKDMWRFFADSQDAHFEMQDLGISIETCVERDAAREKPVGKAIIHRMALFNGLVQFTDKPIVIVDVDGTVACGKHREHFLEGPGKKDWKSYYALLSDDSPIDLVVRWVRELAKENTICIVSGRPDTYQFETTAWLEKHDVPYDYIFMRPGNMKNPDTEIKKSILDHLPKEKIAFVLDDRPSVCRMWQENGLTVYPVRGACEEF